jgi:putative zinc finger/helix-turn-helix YgiT family protein
MTITKCPECGGKVSERSDVVRAQPLGRTVRYEERRLVCEKCGATYLDDVRAKGNDAAWTKAFGAALAEISGDDLRLMREASKLTRPQLEAILGVGTNTIARWEDGTREIPPYIVTMIRMIGLHPTSLRELERLVRAGYVTRERHEDAEVVKSKQSYRSRVKARRGHEQIVRDSSASKKRAKRTIQR